MLEPAEVADNATAKATMSATGVSNVDAACTQYAIRATRWMINSYHRLIHVTDIIRRVRVMCLQVSYCGAERSDSFSAIRTQQGPSGYHW